MGKSALLLAGSCIAICLFVSGGDLRAQTRNDQGVETLQAEAASYVELGDEFAHRGDFVRAIGAYNVALDFVSDFAPAYFKRGLAHQSRGDFSAAIEDYTKTIEIVPQCAEAYANRGYVRGIQHDVEGALSDWSSALEI